MHRFSRRIALAIVFIPILATTFTRPAWTQTQSQRIRLLEKTVQDLLKRHDEQDKLIKDLQRQLQDRRAGRSAIRSGKTKPHRHTAKKKPAQRPKRTAAHKHDYDPFGEDVWSTEINGAVLRLQGINVSVATAGGWCGASNENCEVLFGGDHDPRKTGFTLRTVDLSIKGSLDPYFDTAVNIAFFIDPEGETRLELEEAYLETKEIWGFLKIKGGQFFTAFGQINQLHIHDQDFMTQPVILTRLFGPDGLRGQGVQLKAKIPVPWNAHLITSIQNANGETMVSFLSSDEAFEDRPIGGRMFMEREVNSFDEFAYLARLVNRVELMPRLGLVVGGSFLYGPNATGKKGETYIWGLDASLAYALGGGRRVVWTTEFMQRLYRAAADPDAGFAANTLSDFGLYSQIVWFFHPKWAIGTRLEYASGTGESVGSFSSRQADPFRSDRWRVSPMLLWAFAPDARLSVQYFYDRADFLVDDKTVHSVFVNLTWTFGLGQPPHKHNGHKPDRHAH